MSLRKIREELQEFYGFDCEKEKKLASLYCNKFAKALVFYAGKGAELFLHEEKPGTFVVDEVETDSPEPVYYLDKIFEQVLEHSKKLSKEEAELCKLELHFHPEIQAQDGLDIHYRCTQYRGSAGDVLDFIVKVMEAAKMPLY